MPRGRHGRRRTRREKRPSSLWRVPKTVNRETTTSVTPRDPEKKKKKRKFVLTLRQSIPLLSDRLLV